MDTEYLVVVAQIVDMDRVEVVKVQLMDITCTWS